MESLEILVSKGFNMLYGRKIYVEPVNVERGLQQAAQDFLHMSTQKGWPLLLISPIPISPNVQIEVQVCLNSDFEDIIGQGYLKINYI
jgi:hypothetical protein